MSILVAPFESGTFYVAQENMQTNYTLHEDLGMTHASVVPATIEERRTDISYEEMGLLADVDVLVLRVDNPTNQAPDREQSAGLTGAPLWADDGDRAGHGPTELGDALSRSTLTACDDLHLIAS